jgi:hypothetical protein
MEKVLACLFAIMIVVGVSFGIVYGLIWAICWCFDIAFSFKLAMGVWLICSLFSFVVPRGK